MWPRSDAFARAVRGSHRAVALAEVLVADGPAVVVPVTGGSVQVDDSQAVRRTLTGLQVADPSLVPRKKGDLLHPDTRNEIRLWRGVEFPNGSQELMPLGVFALNRPEIGDDSGSGLSLQLGGSDRAATVARAKWVQPYPITGGTPLLDAATAILADRAPGLPQPAWAPTDATVPAVTFGLDSSSDPWSDLQQLFAAIGHEAFFDPMGRPVSRPIPDPAKDPVVADFTEGSSPLLSVRRSLDPSKRFTAVVVRAEGTGVGSPITITVTLDGATEVAPYFLTSNTITSEQQATDAGNALLRKISRSQEDLAVSIVPDASLDVGDVVSVTRQASGVAGVYAITQLEVPLSPEETMALTMRPRT